MFSMAESHTTDMRVALVHDFLLYPGGAERVLDALIALYPDAPVYTLLYDAEKMGTRYDHVDVRTSFLQKLPRWLRRRYRWLLPFFASAVESFDLRDFDVIISSSGAWSKGLVTRLDTTHVAYIHSPMRYVWDENERYLAQATGKTRGFCVRALLSYLRVWDHQAAQRPDVLIANSEYTRARIAKYYRRDARVVYPPVTCPFTTKELTPLRTGSYFVAVSRLFAYKNMALIVETCNKLQLDLVVIGEGRELTRLRAMAGPRVTVLGATDELTKWRYIAHARAMVFGAEEDFGIVCAEALCVGTPVIALGRGGVCEIIQPGVTGETFRAPTVELVADGIRRFLEKEGNYDRSQMRVTAEAFAPDVFARNMCDRVEVAHRASRCSKTASSQKTCV